MDATHGLSMTRHLKLSKIKKILSNCVICSIIFHVRSEKTRDCLNKAKRSLLYEAQKERF